MAKSISNQIKAYAKQYRQDASVVAETVMINISTDIDNNAPVDTGRYRSNWMSSSGSVSSRTTRSKTRNSTTSAKRHARQAAKKFDKYYFVNNLPYAKAIEYGLYKKNPVLGTKNRKTNIYEIRSKNGFSKQAPKGVVRVAIKRELRRFNKLTKSGKLSLKSDGIRYWDK